MPKFVIQEHHPPKTADQSLEPGDLSIHYDLMLESGDVLKTWRLLHPPDTIPQTAKQIADHRLIYLKYEGEISGNRGFVKIWDKGEYIVRTWAESLLVLEFSGKKTRKILTLRLLNPPFWSLEFPASHNVT